MQMTRMAAAIAAIRSSSAATLEFSLLATGVFISASLRPQLRFDPWPTDCLPEARTFIPAPGGSSLKEPAFQFPNCLLWWAK